jgi:hypothetical protein
MQLKGEFMKKSFDRYNFEFADHINPKVILVISLIFIFNFAVFSQRCDCVSDFDYLVEKVETNYIGYYIKVTDKNRPEYERLKADFRRKAERATDENCVLILREWIEFFKDYHLIIEQTPEVSAEEIEQMAKQIKSSALDENLARAYFDQNPKKLNPIEGLWYSDKGKFAIARIGQENEFIAVVLTPPSEKWKKGQIIARFEESEDGVYKTVYFDENNLSKKQFESTIYKEVLLRIGFFLGWGKSYPLEDYQKNLIDSDDPLNPFLRTIDKDNIVLAIPSFRAENREKLEKVLKSGKEFILNRRNLIIDLRGNTGGNRADSLLDPFVHTGKIKSNEGSLTLSSKDNIAYFNWLKKYIEDNGNKPPEWFLKAIERMEKNPGKIVNYADETYRTPELIYPTPKNVAIITDRANASAVEGFLLDAIQSERVTTFGENTKGNIDYPQVYGLRLKCKERGFVLYYPMYTRTRTLPEGAIDYIGIKPDVPIGKNVKNKIQSVIDYYKDKK